MTSPVHGQDRWLRRFHPPPEGGVRLICFPHAGGSAAYYFPISQALSSSIEVLAVQYPGRQDRWREACIESVPELADRIFDSLRPWIRQPYAFFGHSMGAILAFEVALRIQSFLGTSPMQLFVSGRPAPSRGRNENIHQRDDAGLIMELRRHGGTDPRVFANRELLAAILPVARSDYKAVETYAWKSGPALTCPITALIGDFDQYITIDEVSAWSEHTHGDFDLHIFHGGHFHLDSCRPQVVDTIHGILADRLAQIHMRENG